jgi:hypothetical protein
MTIIHWLLKNAAGVTFSEPEEAVEGYDTITDPPFCTACGKAECSCETVDD